MAIEILFLICLVVYIQLVYVWYFRNYHCVRCYKLFKTKCYCKIFLRLLYRVAWHKPYQSWLLTHVTLRFSFLHIEHVHVFGNRRIAVCFGLYLQTCFLLTSLCQYWADLADTRFNFDIMIPCLESRNT